MDTQAPRGGSSQTPQTAGSPGAVEPAEFAEYLRAERERRRISLDQVSDETKIAHRHLAALERGDVRNWPGGMYRRAMMRAYAESIGVDREFALEQFGRAFDATRPAPQSPVMPLEPAQPLKQARSFRPLIMAICLTAVVAALVTLLWPGEPAPTVQADAATVVAAAPPIPTQTAPVERAAVSADRAAAAAPVELAASTTVAATPPPTAPPRPRASEGGLVVESQPAGARVTINGIGWGETPVTIRHLEFGEKRVRVTLQGYVSGERVVRLSPERGNATVSLALRARE